MQANQRTAERSAVSLETLMRVDGKDIPCRLKNISMSGAQIHSNHTPGHEMQVSLLFDPFGSILGEVAWSRKGFSGIKFVDSPESISHILMGLAIYA